MVTKFILHMMIIASLWIMYSSDNITEFIVGILFWLYYMRRLYTHNTTDSP